MTNFTFCQLVSRVFLDWWEGERLWCVNFEICEAVFLQARWLPVAQSKRKQNLYLLLCEWCVKRCFTVSVSGVQMIVAQWFVVMVTLQQHVCVCVCGCVCVCVCVCVRVCSGTAGGCCVCSGRGLELAYWSRNTKGTGTCALQMCLRNYLFT